MNHRPFRRHVGWSRKAEPGVTGRDIDESWVSVGSEVVADVGRTHLDHVDGRAVGQKRALRGVRRSSGARAARGLTYRETPGTLTRASGRTGGPKGAVVFGDTPTK